MSNFATQTKAKRSLQYIEQQAIGLVGYTIRTINSYIE